MQVSAFTGCRVGAGVAIAVASIAPLLFGDEPVSAKSQKEAPDIAIPSKDDLLDQRIVFAKTALGRYSIQIAGRDEPARLSEVCLRWSNPVSHVKDGVLAVYAYDGGRPVAIGQIFHSAGYSWVHEFAIIAPDETAILREGRPFWKPSEYICRFVDVPDSPVPAAKATLRLSQMRKIAGDFLVVDHAGWEDSEITRHELRLLPQPVYRYAEVGKIIDGGLFEFAFGTDPECNLLIEAYQDEKGSRYRYALSPMSVYQLEARYRDQAVWGIERRKFTGEKCTKYYARFYTPAPGENVPE